jgi:hypothetical protein
MNDHDRLVKTAGFFEGEGCVTIQRSGGGYGIGVVITQNIRDQLDIMQARWGGAVGTHGARASHWQLWGMNAYRFLSDIYPYVEDKAEQIELAIEFANRFGLGPLGSHKRTLEDKTGQEVMRQQMRSLKVFTPPT